jgi:TonB family protein
MCLVMSASFPFAENKQLAHVINRAHLALSIALGCAFNSACASTLAAYPGPRRPAAEVARLHAPDMEIEEIDGYQAGLATGEFEVVPGTHSVLVRIVARRKNLRFGSDESLRVCFSSEAGHTYAILPRVRRTAVAGQGTWYPRIADETVNAWVLSQSLAAETTTCALKPERPIFRIAWPVGQGGLGEKALAERAECFQQIKSRVEALWDPVEAYGRRNSASPDLGMRKWATVLHVRLHADGSLVDTQIVVPSGAPLLDQIAVFAVQKAQTFPAPPPNLVKKTGVVTIPLAFEILTSGQQAVAH